MSRFIDELVRVLSDDPLREKILLCPSRRAGRQWLDRAAMRCGGVVNVRVATVKRLIQDFAEGPLRARGLRPASVEERLRLVGSALARASRDNPGSGYFSRLPASLVFCETLLASLEELEAARLRDGERLSAGIGLRDKAEELAWLLRRYREAKRAARLAGGADVAAAALSALPGGGPDTPLLILPASLALDAGPGERRFIRRWPGECRRELPEDEGPCRADAVFVAADCVADEAREALRRVQRLALPLDRVEVVLPDQETYVPALCAAGLEAFGGKIEDLPFTFNGGVPAFYSRPARLLASWLEWLEAGTPPALLADIVDAGLLSGNGLPGASAPACRFAERLRALPINGAPDDYRRELRRETAGSSPIAAALAGALDDILPPPARGGAAPDLASAPGVLRAARDLLRRGEEDDGKLDAYARTALREAILAWLPHCDWPGFNAVSWLRRLAEGLRVMGMGPLPGRLHVSDLMNGGHSGRPCVFILGLDDTRHPGGARQDPVLLDRERRALSRNLEQSGAGRDRRERALDRLLARLEGQVFLSYARRDSGRNRELFPAPAYLRLRDDRAASPETPTLRPDAPDACLLSRDDWLHALLAKRGTALTALDLAPWFPHPARGAAAAAARESDRFTEWDGRVPEAGREYLEERRPVSPTDLETLAACPLDFFFKRVLRIRPPERYEHRPGRWLEGNERGSLLHDVFQNFLEELTASGGTVDADSLDGCRDRLLAHLEAAVRRQRRLKPPRDALAFERERAELYEAAAIFLFEEVGRQKRGRPICLEAALGGAAEDRPPWNRVRPVELTLDSGAVLTLRGRVDRVDRLRDHGGLVIWDYKTARSANFSRRDPFDSGRHLQPLLYTRMLETVLAEEGIPEPVRGFSYFFPMPRDEGRTLTYDRDMLREGGTEILEALSSLLASGCFPFGVDKADAVFSEYLAVHGDIAALAGAARRKALADPALAAWAELREVS